MNDDLGRDGRLRPDELESLLSAAFTAQASAAVPDHAVPPPPRFAGGPTRHAAAQRRRARLLAPLSAAAAVLLAVGVGVAVVRSGDHHAGTVPAGTRSVASAVTPVHIRLLNGDGQTYGVGMPVVAYFSRTFTDARALQRATTVEVNGTRTPASWYFERSESGYGPIEGHLRPDAYWPARARIHVSIAARALSAGRGLAFDNDLTLDFSTGDREIVTVDGAAHELTVTTNGKRGATYPVSVGAGPTPSRSGIKVIMDKSASVEVHLPGSTTRKAQYAQRLTYDGEFLLAAPWKQHDIAAHINSSNGATDLSANAARALYASLRVGDVVIYTNTGGAAMTLADGLGDWNVLWGEWQTGGLVPTH